MTREHAMQEPETAYEPAEADPLVLLDGHRGRILLAEDDEEFRSLVAAVLRADGYEVVEVADGFDLLQHIALSLIDGGLVEPVNLVVSDIRMPGWSGLEVLASARTAGFDVPFILITAFGDPETHAQARRLDAVAVLDKPFDLDDLRDLVRSTAPIRLALGVEARKKEGLRILLAEDDVELRSMIAGVLRADGFQVVEAGDGTQLLDFLGSVAMEDPGSQAYDIVVSDIRMPGWSGLEILSGLRSSGWDVPFVLITAFGDAETRQRALDLGVTAFFNKPVDMEDLRTVLFNLTLWRLAKMYAGKRQS